MFLFFLKKSFFYVVNFCYFLLFLNGFIVFTVAAVFDFLQTFFVFFLAGRTCLMFVVISHRMKRVDGWS